MLMGAVLSTILPIFSNTATAENGKTIIASISMACVKAENTNSKLMMRNTSDNMLKKSLEMAWLTL